VDDLRDPLDVLFPGRTSPGFASDLQGMRAEAKSGS
jgi:hypothetical protein